MSKGKLCICTHKCSTPPYTHSTIAISHLYEQRETLYPHTQVLHTHTHPHTHTLYYSHISPVGAKGSSVSAHTSAPHTPTHSTIAISYLYEQREALYPHTQVLHTPPPPHTHSTIAISYLYEQREALYPHTQVLHTPLHTVL